MNSFSFSHYNLVISANFLLVKNTLMFFPFMWKKCRIQELLMKANLPDIYL